jgi:predicted nucleotidyltransferase
MDKKPGPSDLASADHQMLMTRCGPLDLFGTIGQGRDYGQLLEEAVEMEIGAGLKVRVATLESLIKTKEQSGREIDQAALPVLRRVLEEKSKA